MILELLLVYLVTFVTIVSLCIGMQCIILALRHAYDTWVVTRVFGYNLSHGKPIDRHTVYRYGTETCTRYRLTRVIGYNMYPWWIRWSRTCTFLQVQVLYLLFMCNWMRMKKEQLPLFSSKGCCMFLNIHTQHKREDRVVYPFASVSNNLYKSIYKSCHVVWWLFGYTLPQWLLRVR